MEPTPRRGAPLARVRGERAGHCLHEAGRHRRRRPAVDGLRSFIAACAGITLLASAMSAHHSDAAFDHQSPITLQGTVRSFAWENPHIRISVDVREPDGTVATWNVEGNPP